MLYDWTSTAALGVVRDIQPQEPLTLTGEGLWVCLISSGRCTASLTDASPSPAGSALILPPQSAAAGHLVLSRAPLTLTPEGESHLLCIQLTGQAAVQFLAGLTELPFLARGETCPAAAELLGRLAAEADTPRSRAASQLAFALLCELAGEGGRVLAFDVQEDAVRQTNELLAREGKHAEVHLDSHAHMESYAAPESVDCIVFNFGRLPGGDPHIFTQADSSIEAVNAGLRLLKPGGVMALAIYYGGENGYGERDALLAHLKTLDDRKYSVLVCDWANRRNDPPIPAFLFKD